MNDVRFPANLKNLTPELVTAVLAPLNPGVQVARVQVIECARCGDGLASTADRVTLQLEYATGKSAGLPQRMVLKTILLHRWLRFGLPVIMMLSRLLRVLDKLPLLGRATRPLIFTLVNVYQQYFPHAPPAMYANEVRFYTELRPHLTLQAPASYGGSFDETTGQFGVLMEDLSRRDARFPNAVDGVSLDVVRDLIKTLAALHAAFWNSARFNHDLAWVPTRTAGGMFPVFDTIGLDIILDQVRKNTFKQDLLAPLGLPVEQQWDALWQAQALLDAGPQTLLHGDTHVGNTYVLPGEKGGLLDFQLMVRGPWAHDTTYLLVTGLDVETRRKHEHELLALYREELQRRGVIDAPSEAQAWRDYRLSVIWGLVIGWLITPPQNYGEPITRANISKLVTAALDLQSFAAVNEYADAPSPDGISVTRDRGLSGRL